MASIALPMYLNVAPTVGRTWFAGGQLRQLKHGCSGDPR